MGVKMRTLLVGLLLLVSFAASAATLTWTNPTTFSDGSALAPADIASTKVEWSATSAFTTVAGSLSVAGSASTTSSPPDPAAGATLCYRVSTVAVAAKGGGTSAPSNVSCKTKPYANPSPPTGLTVLADTVAYETRYRKHQLVAWRDAGTVPAGTSCDGAVRIGGTDLYSVPRESVTDLVRPSRELSAVVVASCG